MSPQPNLSGSLRLGYVIAGVVLIAWGLFYADPGSGRIFGCIVGAVVLIEGLIAYCPACAKLGLGRNKQGEQSQR